MKKVLKASAVLIAPALLYLLFWPVSIDPVAWNPPTAPALEGPYAVNHALASVERLGEGVGPKPEDIAIDRAGRIYGGFEDGRIMRWDANAQHPEVFADTGGRPLGLQFDTEGNLVVADSYKGLLRIAPDGVISTLSTEHGGVPYRFTDDVDIAANGAIYFSDASDKFGQIQFVDDLMEHGAHGRLLAYHPETGETKLLLDRLQFANGIAVDPDQQFVLGIDAGGNVVHNLQDPDGAYAPITSVQEHDGTLYFGSILESAFGRMDLPAKGQS